MRKAYLISLLLILALSSTTFALTLQQGYTAVITSTGASSGVPPYTYQWFSQCPSCGSFSAIPGATYTTYFFDTNSLTELGTWQFQLQGKDSLGTVINSVSTNNVILVKSVSLTISQGYTAVITSTGASSGVPPYTYQWFSQCPSCGSFSAIPGATYTTYFFDTNSLTELGTWQFQLQGKDSVGTVINSLSTNNVILIKSVPLTIPQGYTAVVTSSGASAGVPPYTYQWFSQCPSCGSFSAIPGATYTTYFFDTNSLTEEGTWQFQLQGKDSVGAVVNSVSTNNVIVVNSIIVGGCIPLINANSVIAFPETVPGSFAPTSNVVNIGNAGTATSNILIEGGNWISGTSSFLVGNTLWSATSGGNIGTQLSNTAVDTQIIIPAGDSNSIYFGLNVPTGQAAGTYSQTINALTSC